MTRAAARIAAAALLLAALARGPAAPAPPRRSCRCRTLAPPAVAPRAGRRRPRRRRDRPQRALDAAEPVDPAARPPPHVQARDRDRRGGAEDPARQTRAPRLLPDRVHEGRDAVAGQLSSRERPHRARPGDDRRRDRRACSSRGPASRCRGRWRAATTGAFGRHVNALVHLAAAVPAVPRAVPATSARPCVRAGCTSTCSCCSRFSRLARVLQPGADRPLGAARLPAAASTCWCACCWSRARARRASAAAAAPAGARRLAGARARLPGRLPRRAQRDRLERDRRRLRRRDRRATGSSTASRCTASWPSDNDHGDTYGPVNYYAYVPFERLFGWSGRWDDLPAAHAAAIVFDLLTIGGAVPARPADARPVAGHRARLRVGGLSRSRCSRSRGTPTTRSSALLRRRHAAASPARPAARGALAALAGLTKFAPLALAPLFATHAARRGRRERAAAAAPRVVRRATRSAFLAPRRRSRCCR